MCCITEYKIPDFENQAVFFGFNSLFPMFIHSSKRAVGTRNHSQLSFNHRSVKFFEIPNLCNMGQKMLYAGLIIPHIVSAFYFPIPLFYPTIFAFLYSSGIASPKVSADFLLMMTSSTSGSSTAVSCVLIFPSSTSAAMCPACTPDL